MSNHDLVRAELKGVMMTHYAGDSLQHVNVRKVEMGEVA